MTMQLPIGVARVALPGVQGPPGPPWSPSVATSAVIQQQLWQFDAVNGDDRGDGANVPLKTFAAYFARVEPG